MIQKVQEVAPINYAAIRADHALVQNLPDEVHAKLIDKFCSECGAKVLVHKGAWIDLNKVASLNKMMGRDCPIVILCNECFDARSIEGE
jgi:hypothetical protein